MDPLKIQFSGGPCGQHGPYTFYKSFKYSKQNKTRYLSLGEFFYVRVLEDAPICIGELQLLWVDKNQPEYQLCSLRLYFAPENTPDGRLPHHGKDEILAEGEKVVLDLPHLIEWIVEEDVKWTHGSLADCKANGSTSCSSLAKVFTSSNCALKFQEKYSDSNHNNESDQKRSSTTTDVVILSYAQYSRYRCILRRFEKCPNKWLKDAVISAIAGVVVQSDDVQIMFCRDTIDHPFLEDHEFRLDHMVPLLKGRRRKKMSFKRDSGSEPYDSDQSASTQSPDPVFKPPSSPVKQESPKIVVPSKAPVPPQTSSVIVPKSKPPKTFCPEDHKVNSPEELEFLEKLFSFMRNYHRPIERLPTLGFKEVDLFLFFGYAQRLGGYEKVTQNRQWKQIYDMLGGNPNNTSAATCTRRIYEKLLLPFERFMNGEHLQPLADTCPKPIHKQLISNMAGNSPKPDEKPTVKIEDKVPRPKKLHKTVQEILNHQRGGHEDKMDDVFAVDSKDDVYPTLFTSERQVFPPSRPSVIHSLPVKQEAEARKRTYVFCDDPPKAPLSNPPHAHAIPSCPKSAKVPKPNDYIDQLRQAQQKSKSDPDENSAPLDLSMKAARPLHRLHMPLVQQEKKPPPPSPSKQSAFKSIEALSASAQKPTSSSSQPTTFHPSLPLPIVHPAFTHFAAAGILPPPSQFSQPFLYPLTSDAGVPQVVPQLMYSPQSTAGASFLIPSIPLFPPQAIPHVNSNPSVNKR